MFTCSIRSRNVSGFSPFSKKMAISVFTDRHIAVPLIYCAAIVTVFEFKFAVVTMTGIAFPGVTPVGNCTLTWYRPTNPGDKPANRTVADCPPIVTLTCDRTLDKLLPLPAATPVRGGSVTRAEGRRVAT